MFNLEKEIKKWEKTLRKNRAFEEGYIEELESHLRDLIDKYLLKNLSEEKAFDNALADLGEAESIGDEFYKTDTKNISGEPYWKTGKFMPSLLFHNIKIGYRSLKRTAWYSSLNIAGLAIGMACSILIILWIQTELSYDKFHRNIDNLYRAYQIQEYSGTQTLKTDNLPGPLASALKDEFPEVENAARFIRVSGKPLKYSDKFFNEMVYFTDTEFFQIFDFPLKKGDKETVLSKPFSIVITEKIAEKYFDDENPLGKILTIDHKYDFTVTGIINEIPLNSHLRGIDILVPFSNTKEIMDNTFESWGYNWPRTYIQLKEGTKADDFENKINGFLKKHPNTTASLFIQPVSKIRLYTLTGEDGFITYIYIVSVIGIAVLLIACINFINLSTARSKLRSREVGLRKVTGAQRVSLIFQFLGESVLLTLIALFVAVIIIFLSLPSINNLLNELTGTTIIFDLFGNRLLILALISITIITGIISGLYPAVYLSSFQPVQILRKDYRVSNKSLFRDLLVVVQFACSIILIITSLIISSQLEYLSNSELGYNHKNLVYVPFGGESRNKYETIKNELLKSPDILDVTATSRVPLSGGDSSWGFEWEGKDPELKVLINTVDADPNYIEAMGMQIVEGNKINKSYLPDDPGPYDVLMNENAIKRMDLESPVGKFITYGSSWKGRIVGIVKDFHFSSFYQDIEPMLISADLQYTKFLLARLNERNIPDALNYLEETWYKINPSTPFTYTFLDKSIEEWYQTEKSISKLLKYFTAIAIFIACLGLLGLSSFTAERHTKEIGIRKVLGSSVASIVLLLTKEFSKWVVLSNIMAWPIAYYLSNQWLESFVYRIDIQYWTFLISGLAALVIALVTVSFHTIKAAVANPINSIKYE
ncbi:MAG: ABC transporter permease [Ignavibacteria bacterium]|jgi:ABC-type antimicrobial peptide transport system permease subunit